MVPPGRLRSDPSSSGLLPPRAMVATAPTEATAGLYVFESVYGGAVVVGPTHHVQDSKEDRQASADELVLMLSLLMILLPLLVLLLSSLMILLPLLMLLLSSLMILLPLLMLLLLLMMTLLRLLMLLLSLLLLPLLLLFIFCSWRCFFRHMSRFHYSSLPPPPWSQTPSSLRPGGPPLPRPSPLPVGLRLRGLRGRLLLLLRPEALLPAVQGLPGLGGRGQAIRHRGCNQVRR